MSLQQRITKLEDGCGLSPKTPYGLPRGTIEIYDPESGEIVYRSEGDPGGVVFRCPDNGRGPGWDKRE